MQCDCSDAPSFDSVVIFLRDREAFHLEKVAKLSKLPNVERRLAYENGKADAYKEALNTLIIIHSSRMKVVKMPARNGFKNRARLVLTQIVGQLKNFLHTQSYIKVGG